MSYNPKSLFSQIQKKEQEAATNSGVGQQFTDEYLLKPTKVGTLTVRLLWLPPIKGVERDYPMINSYVHEFWDSTNKKFGRVICPTSQYMEGETINGFKSCPICSEMSKFYKKGQEGSESAKQMYKNFRRTCKGYIPVYIVNGMNAQGEDISGQIKILQYGKQFKDFFNSKIFGITSKNNSEDAEPINPDDIIGLEAFMWYNEDENKIEVSGYDLIITTTSKSMNINGKNINMPQYSLDFGRKIKTIDTINGIDLTSKAGVEFFKNINNDINFDKDFLVKSTEAERQEFVTNFIIKNEANDIEEDIPIKETKSSIKKTTTPVEKQTDEEPEEPEKTEDEEINVDDLLAGLTN